MPKRGDNIHKRKDGRWEGRYIKSRDISGKAKYGSIYGKTYNEVKFKLVDIQSNNNIKSFNRWVTNGVMQRIFTALQLRG